MLFAKELARALPLGRDGVVSPFGVFEGRIDLRGLSLPRGIIVRKANLENVDLSNCSLNGAWIESSSFSNVLFNETSLKEVADHGNIFINCDFIGTDFRQAALGYRGSRYNGVKFIECDFRKAAFIRAEFNDTEFVECRLEGVDFNASSFVSCNFRGIIKEVWFRGGYGLPHLEEQFGVARKNEMKNVSFLHATLDGVTFSDNCELSSITLPHDSTCIRVQDWPQRLIRILDQFESNVDEVSREVVLFSKAHMIHAEKQPVYILSKQDLIKEYGVEAANIILKSLN